MSNSLFLIFSFSNSTPIGIGVEFEKSGKIVIENKDNSLTYYSCLDDFLLSNKNYHIKRI